MLIKGNACDCANAIDTVICGMSMDVSWEIKNKTITIHQSHI